MAIICNHGHKQFPFENQLPENKDIAEYKLWLCSKCHKWYSLLPTATYEFKLAQRENKNATIR